jgi:RNA polymerase sigma-70 factor (ECF subfamily)
VNQGGQAADLHRRAKAGDLEAFDELLAPLIEPAFALAMAMLNDRGEAEDAVQEAALRTWQKIARFRTGANLRPWFLAIVANQCRTVRRSRWWHVLRSSDVSGMRRHEMPEANWGERIDLEAALGRLPKNQLAALTLYYHLDLPIDEVARVLGCSPAAARQRIHRALDSLRPGMTLELNE